MTHQATRSAFHQDGFVSPVPILTSGEATKHRQRLEAAEAHLGSVNLLDKAHVALPTVAELVTHPVVLDTVEACIGPDILLYNSTYLIKEPGSAAHVSWHQDLTYWGLADDDAQVSMWLALSPATEESGCMTMVPGSHTGGAQQHHKESDADNLLLMGQHLATAPTTGQLCPLAPGEASFHHGWTVHASAPNVSADRRIGLNVQYLAPHNRFSGDGTASGVLVRGQDPHGHFAIDPLATVATGELPGAETMARWTELDQMMKAGFQSDPATG